MGDDVLDGFEFEKQADVGEEVETKGFFEGHTLVDDGDRFLARRRNAPEGELMREAFLINRFE